MKAKITKRSVEGVVPGPAAVLLWDTDVRGFGCKVLPSGQRVYLLQYSHRNRDRRVTIGRHGELTPEEARREAQRLRGRIAAGADPAQERATERAAPTLAELADRYLAEHAGPKKKPRSAEEDARNIKNHLLPALGHVRVGDLARADVARLHAAMKSTPVAANRTIALLSAMMSLAEEWGLRSEGTNPVRGIKRYPEQHRQRFLSEAELARLGEVLREAEAGGEHPSVVNAIRLLLFTGCRRDEILKLRWSEVDLDHGRLVLSDSKTGAKSVPLGEAAVRLLSGLSRRDGNPFVLPGAKAGRHYVGLEKAWSKLRARAGLADLRLHDLRHSFASAGAGAGESLMMIGALLGHRSPTMTQRYAHLSDDPVRAAADRITGRLAVLLEGDSSSTGSASDGASVAGSG